MKSLKVPTKAKSENEVTEGSYKSENEVTEGSYT